MRNRAIGQRIKEAFMLSGILVCASACQSGEKPYIERPLKDLYRRGYDLLRKESYKEAAEAFDDVEQQYPYSSWASKAQLMSAYASFKAQDFLRAIGTLDVFITLHSSSKYAPYAYYLRALSYYTDMVSPHRDKESAELAQDAFEEVMKRFPNTDYAHDATLKVDFIKEHLASQEMIIIRYYMQEREYVAAFQRLSEMIGTFSSSVLMPEALYRLIECHVNLGLTQVSHKTLAMLQYNFPKSSWTAAATDLIQHTVSQPKRAPAKPVLNSPSKSGGSKKNLLAPYKVKKGSPRIPSLQKKKEDFSKPSL